MPRKVRKRAAPRVQRKAKPATKASGIEQQLPQRMPIGSMFRGPEYYGCVGTGLRPTILHSRYLKEFPISARGYRFAVGPELFVEDAVTRLLHGKVRPGQAFVEYDNGRRRVTFAKTYATAKKRFLFLCKEVTDDNAKQAAKHQELLAGARKGDMGAILGLADF